MKTYYLIFLLVFFLIAGLRVYKLDVLPPSPYWEEAALGFDAYSILKTGKDHHGNFMPLTAFESFGDWKPSLYFYTLVPFIYLLDLSIWSVRLPAALAGIMTIFATAQLVISLSSKFLPQATYSKKTQYLLSLFIAGISPWGIIFSRAAWEVMLATALISWGVVFGVLTLERIKYSRFYFFLMGVLFALSMYAYHSARIVAPALGLLFFFLLLLKNKSIKTSVIPHLFTLIVVVAMVSPFLLQFKNPQLQHRFAETSIFSDISVIQKSNALKEIAHNSWFSSLLYHRYVLFSKEVIRNFFSHFTFSYLFVQGDQNPRHSVQYFGMLYPLEVIALISGLLVIIKKKSRYTLIIITWLMVGILPASITQASPHALRTLLTFPTFMIIVTFGWLYLLHFLEVTSSKYTKLGTFIKKVSFVLLISTYLLQLVVFWRFYNNIYPLEHSAQWQYGYKELITQVELLKNQNSELPVYITRAFGRPAMYYWFYTKTSPTIVQNLNDSAQKDQGEFLTFENIFFQTGFTKESRAIVALSKDEFDRVTADGVVLKNLVTIFDLRNQPIAYIGIYEK